MHEGQLDITAAAVANLVAEQAPQWSDLPVRRVESTGTVNALFTLGDDLVARLPLVSDADAADALDREVAAAALFAERTTVPTPTFVLRGVPGANYPMPWSVWRWIRGRPVAGDPGVDFAHALADFVLELRAIPTRGRVFAGEGRGGLLADHDAWVQHCLAQSGSLIDTDAVARMWANLRGLERDPAQDRWTHNDLMPGNLLIDGRALGGVIDVGQAGVGDPAVDLQPAWNLLGEQSRAAYRDRLGVSGEEWQRGRAWALIQAMGSLWYYVDSNPAMSRVAEHTLHALLSTSGE